MVAGGFILGGQSSRYLGDRKEPVMGRIRGGAHKAEGTAGEGEGREEP